MFDSLRDEANSDPFDSTPFYEDEQEFRQAEQAKAAPPRKAARVARPFPSSEGRFLGMTPAQRFALALMLFITVCVVGSMLLIVTGKLGLI